MSSDNAQRRATDVPRLEWQGELDSAMADIDSRLTHRRRRASDADPHPMLPERRPVQLTNELLDEIASRVAEQIRRKGGISVPAPVTQARKPAPDVQKPQLEPGKMLMIRFKLPLLPWPLRLFQRRYRKKQHPLTTARLRA